MKLVALILHPVEAYKSRQVVRRIRQWTEAGR